MFGTELAGIAAVDVDLVSPGTQIHHNVVFGPPFGATISIRASGGATIRNNILPQGSETGIRAETTTGVTIAQNLVQRHDVGIRVENSSDITIRNNILRDTASGIFADSTTAVTILRNLVQHNGSGIVVQRSTDCLVALNGVAFHTGYGIHLDAIDGCTIERNNVSRSELLDCFWEGSGSNAFVSNSCATEEPPGAWE